tara:strand:+ start:471 stop:596 length:126 start_codon:yes stop_codon:yes gene_type:complete
MKQKKHLSGSPQYSIVVEPIVPILEPLRRAKKVRSEMRGLV